MVLGRRSSGCLLTASYQSWFRRHNTMCYYHAERLKHFVTNNMNHQAQQLLSMTKYDDFSFGLQRKADVLSIRNYSAHSLSCSYNPSKCSRNINDKLITSPATFWYQNSVHVTFFIIHAVVWLERFHHRLRCWQLGQRLLTKHGIAFTSRTTSSHDQVAVDR